MPTIAIVGGGTAGWLAATYLNARLGTPESNLCVKLIEPADIPSIGVGEATVPSIRATLSALGVSEYEFMRSCSATFKHGIKFAQWVKSPEEEPGEFYFHPFEKPLAAGLDNIGGHWLRGRDPAGRAFADAVSIQQSVSSEYFAPKKFDDPSFIGPLPYAYHLDAGQLIDFLKEIGARQGVEAIDGRVVDIESEASGRIQSVILDAGEKVSADLFIDCSGFRALLIEGHFKTDFEDLTRTLFCDRAVASQIPESKAEYSVRPYTLATAQGSGWTWDISLTNRRGTGYVYSSKYQDLNAAEQTLRDYIGPKSKDLSFRHLEMRVGTRKVQWKDNCVALGLSAGFVEPLESTGIHFVEVAMAMLVQMIPRFLRGGVPQGRFNEIMFNHYKSAIDFIKLHYYLSDRRDTQFWRDNTSEDSLEDDLREKLASWTKGYPDVYDLRFLHSIFDHSSYQYVFFGMRKRPNLDLLIGDRDAQSAVRRFENVTSAVAKAKSILSGHNQILNQINT